MYHAIVRRVVRRNYQRINEHDYEPLLAGCAPDVRHRFGGDHALGGERRDRDTFRRWLERLGRLAPELSIVVEDVWVMGLPHDTVAIARWHATQPTPDGSPYLNRGVHVFRLRWGRVVDVDVHEDSQLVAKWLALLGERGTTEAAAEKIVS